MIPIKDATILSRMEDPELRRIWRQRIVDHDGENAGDGGIERWLMLTEGLGFERGYVTSLQGLLPGTRFAVDAYVHFVREKPMLEAIASSLTELFSPNIISERVSGMLKNYDFISEKTLAYFGKRLTQAPRDADFALAYVKEHARTAKEQAAVCAALRFKCRRAVDAARRAAACLCRRRRHDPARRLEAGTRGVVSKAVSGTSIPKLPRGVRLHFDQVREAHVLLAPERAFNVDGNAVAVLQLVDGTPLGRRHRRYARRKVWGGQIGHRTRYREDDR